MNERKHARWLNRFTCLVGIALSVVVAGVALANPLQSQKKPGSTPQSGKATKSTESVRKAEAGTTSPGNSGPGPVVARVNGEEISYKALAEEVIARKGQEVLETMISRLLVEQACRERGIKITAQEIHDEVNRTAERLNMSPEQYLKMLKERRGLTYEQYERDIVWPGLALKKMARPFVTVTEEDIEKGFEAYYGEKMKCRWIMVNDLPTAMKVWNELKSSDKENDGKIDVAEFERQVTRWSVDPGSRTLGGQLQPISRHTSPAFKAIEDAAFGLQEDGEISKVVQFGEAWIILYRESRIAPAIVKLADVRDKIEMEISEAKMREQIEQIFVTMQKSATVENLLTGEVLTPEKQASPAEHTEAPRTPAKSTGGIGDSSKKSPNSAKK